MNREDAEKAAAAAIAHYVVHFIDAAVDLGLVTLLKEVLEKMRPAAMFFGEQAMTEWNQTVTAYDPTGAKSEKQMARAPKYSALVRDLGILFTEKEINHAN